MLNLILMTLTVASNYLKPYVQDYYVLFLIPYPILQTGKYREALGKWESALTLTPEVAVLHEQKAQVLLEIGDAWNALKAAMRVSLFFILNLVYFKCT